MTDEVVESTLADIATVEPVSPELLDIPAAEEAPVVSKYEEAARAKGWRPKEEFIGDPTEFRGAKEWIERGEILDTVHSLKRQLKEQSDSLQHMAEFNKKIETVTRERTIAELEARHRASVEIGDIAGASAAAKEMIRVSTESTTPVPVPTGPVVAPEAQAFVERNASWFNESNAENSAMKSFAIKRDAEIAAEVPGISAAEAIRRLESDLKRVFPHKFAAAPVSAVGAPSSAPARTKETALPEYHRKMIDKLSRTVKNFDKAAYIKLAREIGEI